MGRCWNKSISKGLASLVLSSAEGENQTTFFRCHSLRFRNPSVSILPPRENSRFPDPFPRSSLSLINTV